MWKRTRWRQFHEFPPENQKSGKKKMVQAEPWGNIEQKLVRQSQNVQSAISVKHFRAEKRDEHTQVLAMAGTS